MVQSWGERREGKKEEEEMRDAEDKEAKILKRSARERSTRRVPRGRVDVFPRSVQTMIGISKKGMSEQ